MFYTVRLCFLAGGWGYFFLRVGGGVGWDFVGGRVLVGVASVRFEERF